MLTLMRRLAGTWVARILFVLLIFSFAVWGVEDMFRNAFRDDFVVTVAGESIPFEEAQVAARREIQRIARQLGPTFEANDNLRRAVAAQAVEGLIADRALRAEARREGVGVPEAAVRETVWAIRGLQGADGQFSRILFEQFLRANELNEQQFLNLVRADLARQQLLGAIRAGASGPDTINRQLLRWEQERRIADVVPLTLAEAAEPAAPTEAQLQRFHENNPDRFSTPEFRTVTFAWLSGETLLAEVEVPEAELQAAYDARRAQFETPERRELEQALFPDEAKAREAAALWAAAGEDRAALEAKLQEAGGQLLPLGLVDREGLPLPDLAEAAFTTPAGGVSAPVQTPFGWHVVKVLRIEPGASRSFDEVKEELKRDVALERAMDLAYERANRVEDALAGGATLEEVARRFGLAAATVRVDAQGRDAAGTAVELPVPAAQAGEALRQAFAAAQGAAPRLSETPAGLYAFDVKEVTPAALKPFTTVEAEVRRAWTADARRRGLEERAAALLAAVRGGKPLIEAATEAGLRGRRVGPFQRTANAETPLNPELLAPLFEAKPGEATMAETRDGFAVAQLAGVVPFDPDADPLGLGRTRSAVEQAMADDLEAQFAAALRARAEVTINRARLEQVAGQ